MRTDESLVLLRTRHSRDIKGNTKIRDLRE